MADALLIERLRRHFCELSPWLAARHGWTEQDLADMGDGIREAIVKEDSDALVCWRGWMADKLREKRADIEFERAQFLAELDREAKELNRRRMA
jgi:hypothetical protein